MRAKLTLVPKTEPDPVQAVRERVKAMPRPEGWLQCNKCGSRTMFTAVNGSWIDGKGQYHRKAREAPPFRAGRDRAARVACHVVAFRTQHS